MHTLWDRWTCANGKEWSEAQRKSSLLECTWLKKWVWILNLETFLIHIFLYLSFLSLYSFFYYFSFFHYYFFICSPWTVNCIVHTSSPMIRRLLVLGKRGDRDKVGTRNIFPLERYLKSSTLAPSCNLPWIDDPYSMIGCGQGGKHKRWYFWF
jgi:hypothetical protein